MVNAPRQNSTIPISQRERKSKAQRAHLIPLKPSDMCTEMGVGWECRGNRECPGSIFQLPLQGAVSVPSAWQGFTRGLLIRAKSVLLLVYK